MKSWVNVHQHGAYSMLDGLCKYEPLLLRAKELGMAALGITEHGNVHGWMEFYHAAKEIGVKPILGMEAYQARKTRFDKDEEERSGKAADERDQRGPYHLTLLARNKVGYHNLMRLSSLAFLEGYYGKPRLDHELLDRYSEGIIIVSGCLNGEVNQAILRGDLKYAREAASRFQDIVGKENFFIEVMDHGIEEQTKANEQLLEIAKWLDAPIVPTADCHYVHKHDAHLHDIMLCVSTGSRMEDENRFRFHNDEFYLKDYEEMALIFPDEWLKNTLDLADLVDIDLSDNEMLFPQFPIPENKGLNEYFNELAWEGLARRYGDPLPDDVKARAEHELAVVEQMGFQEYYLVVSDIVRWAKDNDISVGYGRGSAAGSILAYALDITNIDPINFGLIFERFLVPGRKSMPDIDLDFDDRYRDRVIDYACDKYGADRVARICTFTRIKARTAIKDAARVLGYDFITGDKLSKMVPPPVLGVTKPLREYLKETDALSTAYKDGDSRIILDAALGLEGVVRQTGIHAAGIVITPSPLINHVPVMRRGEDKPISTQWEQEWVESNGLLKIDFLGLRNLGIVADTVKGVYERTGEIIDIDNIPLDDELTYREFCKGNAVGVFQLESRGMRDMTLALQPSRIEDIMALISLYRPGPMGSGMDKMYVARKHGREKIRYDHPLLEAVLDKSYGIMLYQEDVLAVCHVLAGFDAGQADDLRKAMGKKQMDKIGTFRQLFVDGCKETNGIDEKIANKVYSDLEYFGGYGFNKSHAISYAMVSYVTGYLKFNYPAEYMASLLSSVTKNKGKGALYLYEAKRMGINIEGPSVTNSVGDFCVIDNDNIQFGLYSIDGIGEAVVDPLVDNRSRRKEKYTSVYDFLRHRDTEMSSAILENFIDAGAFDHLVPEQEHRLLTREDKLGVLKRERSKIGMFLTDHPLSGIWHILEPMVDCAIADIEDIPHGAVVRVAGIFISAEHIVTKRGKKMARFTIEDLTGRIDGICFAGSLDKYGDIVAQDEIVQMDARVVRNGDDENQNTELILLGIRKPSLPSFNEGEPIVLSFDDEPNLAIISKIEALINDVPGDSPVYVAFSEGAHRIKARFKKPTSLELAPKLNELVELSNNT